MNKLFSSFSNLFSCQNNEETLVRERKETEDLSKPLEAQRLNTETQKCLNDSMDNDFSHNLFLQ